MTNVELLDLLREARRLIHTTLDIDALRDWARESDDGEPSLDDSLRHLRANIDAALASANAPTVVAWRTIGGDNAFWEAYPDAETSLDATQYEDGRCRWTACVEREDGGYCNSLAEAKAAAEAAMKRLK